MKFAHDVGKFVDGAGKLAGVHHKLRDAAEGEVPGGALGDGAVPGEQIEDPAQNHDEGKGQVIDEIDGGADDGTVIFRFVIRVHRLGILFVELFRNLSGAVIGPDRLGARQHFLGKAVQLAQLSRPLAEEGLHLFRLQAGEGHGDGHGDGEHEDEGTGDVQHVPKGPADGVNACEDLNEIGGQGSVHRVHVVGNAAHDVPRRVRVEIGDGQSGEIFKQLPAHPVGDFLAEADHRDDHEIGEQGRNEITEEHFCEAVPYDVHAHAALRGNGVDRLPEIARSQKGEIVGRERERDSGQRQRPEAEHVAEQPAEHVQALFLCRGSGPIQRSCLPSVILRFPCIRRRFPSVPRVCPRR